MILFSLQIFLNNFISALALGEGTLDVKKFKDLAIKNDAYVVLEVKQSSDLLTTVPDFKAL